MEKPNQGLNRCDDAQRIE